MRVNRLRSPSSRSRALCARGPNSARWPSSTPTVAVSVVSGERSSWLTSEVNLASRSMRSCRFAVIRLNAEASSWRSTSSPTSIRVSSSPPAMATAASVTSESGRSARELAHRPTAAPARVVTRAAAASAKARARSVPASSSNENTSK